MNRHTLKALLCLVISVSNTIASASDQPRWTVTTLTQQKSLHDGPNCFNAALAAAGFMDTLMYVEGAEYRFYLENFCEANKKDPHRAGNLYAFLGREMHPFLDEPPLVIVHGALSLGSGLIFEKTSNQKIDSKSADAGLYKVKARSQSPFQTGFDGVEAVKSFTCVKPEIVRQRMTEVHTDTRAGLIQNLRLELAEKMKSEKIPDLSNFRSGVDKVTTTLNSIQTAGTNDVYVLVSALSLYGAMASAIEESDQQGNTELTESLQLYKEACTLLADRMKARVKHPQFRRIFNEIN